MWLNYFSSTKQYSCSESTVPVTCFMPLLCKSALWNHIKLHKLDTVTGRINLHCRQRGQHLIYQNSDPTNRRAQSQQHHNHPKRNGCKLKDMMGWSKGGDPLLWCKCYGSRMDSGEYNSMVRSHWPQAVNHTQQRKQKCTEIKPAAIP